MAEWILYDKRDCPFCWKVRLALVETGQNFELRYYPDSERPTEVKALNPGGTVPILYHADVLITDSALALEYIEDVAGPALLPKDPRLRHRARTFHHYSTSVIGPAVREAIFEMRDKPEAERDHARIEKSVSAWGACLDYMEGQLGGEEFFAEAFSVAECALVPRLGLAEGYGIGVDSSHPQLLRWYRAIKTRPSFQLSAPLGLPCEFSD
jgi:glutathione S-transferase